MEFFCIYNSEIPYRPAVFGWDLHGHGCAIEVRSRLTLVVLLDRPDHGDERAERERQEERNSAPEALVMPEHPDVAHERRHGQDDHHDQGGPPVLLLRF